MVHSQVNEQDSMKKSRDTEKQLKYKVEGQNAVIKSLSWKRRNHSKENWFSWSSGFIK